MAEERSEAGKVARVLTILDGEDRFERAEADDLAYCESTTVEERLSELEQLRREMYGNDRIDARLPRFLEFTDRA